MSDHVEKLEHLQSLRDKGTLTEEEFQSEKAKILSDEGSVIHAISEAVKPTEKNEKFRTYLFILLGIAVLAFVAYKIIGGSHEGTPAYVKDVVALQEGSDALAVYFILADQSGAMISASGSVKFSIVEIESHYGRYAGATETENILYSGHGTIKSSDFQDTKVGRGAFEHQAILYSIGRIPYTEFTHNPSGATGKIRLLFASDKDTVVGEGRIIF